MQPIPIFRFSRTEGPGYFADFLDRHQVPWRVVALDAGEPVPESLAGIGGIGMMGGPMSVNDDLPWVQPMEALLRQAVAADLPVIGHCLGGQLLARALGAPVTRAPNVEIGWHEVKVEATPVAREWLGDAPTYRTFEWHNESFALPPGATRVLTNAACPNQAYALGNSIGLQCHIEMTRELVRIWVHDGVGELSCGAERSGPHVQSAAEITADLDADLARLNAMADRIYTRWIAGLALGA
ncbi:MAG: type 1 glutamine amidotransferase [Betaproteobacteria bacterium]|nr:type 1 glutamine amidotransferase [Betaproteobacteria bacterium]